MATKRKPIAETPRIPDALIVERTLFKITLEERIDLGKNFLNRPIARITYYDDLETDFSKWDNYNSEYLKQSFNNEDNEYKHDYDDVNRYVGISSFFGRPDSPQEKYEILRKKISNKINNLENLVEKIPLLKLKISEQPAIKESVFSVTDNDNIFIVHGHNTDVQQAVARVIEKLGLKPIILHEQANDGKTLIEKLEKHSVVGFAIILMTDDDEGKAKTESTLRNRARQNVILELGYFIGKLGRERVLPLYSDSVELPSDIHGLLYTSIDKSNAWKFAIAKELKSVGYNVDADNLL